MASLQEQIRKLLKLFEEKGVNVLGNGSENIESEEIVGRERIWEILNRMREEYKIKLPVELLNKERIK
jgi:hypothetical protein